MSLVVFVEFANAQVKTNFNNTEQITASGKFLKNFLGKSPYVIPAKDHQKLLDKEALTGADGKARPFKIAEVVMADIDVVSEADWIYERDYAYAKFSIVATNAKSISANFDRFFLPQGTELYVYNENGEMITGPVSEAENNANNFWGTWVYKGEKITIDLKIPFEKKSSLQLHINSVAYGYKEIYRAKVANFGESGSCNVNVICPDGNGWENERNSVALILDANSQDLCSGALINNSCNLNIPYLLTANHCFATSPQQNVANWKFTFQAWSSTCPFPGTNADGITFNGSTLRANNDNSDFCLVELNQTPPINSGITYAGWNRSNTAANSAVCLHHPRGDVMKITIDNNPPTRESAFGGTNNHWKATWDIGVTEPGSSGSPLFDQNHRIVGQLHGGPSVCGGSDLSDFYGCFDLSWTGGGTNSTRLSDWLDPLNSGAMTANTINIANTTADFRNTTVTGTSPVCSVGNYASSNPAGTVVTWSSSNSSALLLTSTQGVNPAEFTRQNNFYGQVTVTATVSGGACSINVLDNVEVGVTSTDYTINCSACVDGYLSYCLNTTYSFGISGPGGSNYQWTIPQGWQSLYVSGNAAVLRSPSTSNPPTGTLSCTLTDLCGIQETKSMFTAYSCHQTPSVAESSTLTTSPNPASSALTVEVIDSTANNSSAQLQQPYHVYLYNRMTQTVYSTQSSDKTIQIPISNLPDDVYYLNVLYKNAVLQRQVVVKK
jgi:hypothetical protein